MVENLGHAVGSFNYYFKSKGHGESGATEIKSNTPPPAPWVVRYRASGRGTLPVD